MPRTPARILTAFLLLAPFAGAADDPKLAIQKKTAQENWALLEAGEPIVHETEHLVIFASKSLEGRLKETGATLEKHYGMAEGVLKLDPKKELWAGKLTVYLFAERDEFTTYVRRVAKRRLDPEETSGRVVEGDTPNVYAGPPRSKQAVNLELHAAEEVAAALLQKKAGAQVPLPDWLQAGFGRATTWRIGPREKVTTDARKQAIDILMKKRRSIQQVWNNEVDPEEAVVLRPSLADLLAYGPGTSRFPQFVTGFRPEENQPRRSTEQALETAGIKVENLAKVWPDFVRNLR